MARHRKPRARKDAARRKQMYVLEHQRELAEEERKRYLLTLDPETNHATVRSLERTTSAFGLRSVFGEMMRRVFMYSATPIPMCDIAHFRFANGLECTDNYEEILLRWYQRYTTA